MQTSTEQPPFTEGLLYLGKPWSGFKEHGETPVLGIDGRGDICSRAAHYQTALAADALRYLTLQLAATKASGHPGGFCSSAEAVAALWMLGHKDVFTEVGHHAPGYYAALFLDGSLERMGIRTVTELGTRFRETHGLLGHLSGAVPGVAGPAGPLGQGQHFAMAAARLYPGRLFPVTIGDGGMGEPYVMSALRHFRTAYPAVTNFLPVLVWNGFSQEHHSMVATDSDEAMVAWWRVHGFDEVMLVDAAKFDDAGQHGAFVDSTRCSLAARLDFTGAVLAGMRHAAQAALEGRASVFILKQLKGAGTHASGSKSHHLYPQFNLQHEDMVAALQRRALPMAAWATVRANLQAAGGGPAADLIVTERVRPVAELGSLPVDDFPVGGEPRLPSSAIASLVAVVGRMDPDFIVANADGNEASGLRAVSDALIIRHPVEDSLYSQGPEGRVYEPLSEDACAGLTGATTLLGARSLWFSYESFAVNGLPFFQTVAQALAELRRPTPSLVALFTAGALEQGRNGWTHQRPEVEAYFGALMRTGNVFPVFPVDANGVQAAYGWALGTQNQAVAIFCAKTAVPVRLNAAQSHEAMRRGAVVVWERSARLGGRTLVLAVVGDLVLGSALAAAEALAERGHGLRVVAVVNPQRIYRDRDVATAQVTLERVREANFMSDDEYSRLFDGDAILGLTGGAAAILEPVLLRTTAPRRDLVAWCRGDTTAGAAGLLAFNGLDADNLILRGEALLR
jgi:phosphoketolase